MRDAVKELQAELERRHIPYEYDGHTLMYTATCECCVECTPFGQYGIWYSGLPECDYVVGDTKPMLDRLFEICTPLEVES